jgi:hypothetical protein
MEEHFELLKKIMKKSKQKAQSVVKKYRAMVKTEDTKVDILLTKNFFDFENSQILNYHPEQLISKFLL